MASDFDDIFGDLKEDEHFSATLPSDFDEASIFGDSAATSTSSSSAFKPQEVDKPTAGPGSDHDAVAQQQELPSSAPVSEMVVAPAPAATMVAAPSSVPSSAKPLWEQIGGTEQDDFLSWLDDGAEAPPSGSSPPPALDAAPDAESAAMDDISLDTPRSAPAEPVLSENPFVPPANGNKVESAVMAPPALRIHVVTPAAAAAAVTQESVGNNQISLDDDDDDDDFLEKIVENAKKKAASNSRESSNSSLQIKSQSSSLQRVPVLDFDALYKDYSETGIIPAASRLAMWRHALQASNSKESISMYALQTTPLDLANQALLRKEIESLCGNIFSSKLYLEMVQSSAAEAQDTADGARLLFIDNAEILMTYLCKKLQMDNYMSGMALTFAPLITTGGNDPLRLELVETLLAVCHRVLPHLPKHLSTRAIASARRPLLKWLLLYHVPEIAFHLDQHFHTWNLSVAEAQSVKSPCPQNGVILDSWIASMFESESYHEFDFLMKVWDCCLLIGGGSGISGTSASHEYASTCMCFIVVHLIASRAGKKLLRMESDQLRHCMGQTLVEGLKDTGDKLIQEVQKLIDATPPSFCSKLREVGYAPPPPSTQPAAIATSPLETFSKKNSTSNLGMSLISASATGVKELSSAMIDMPTKLLFMGSSSKAAVTSSVSPGSTTKEDPSQSAKQLVQDVSEAGESTAISMRLAASDVITQVFQSFQTPAADERIRYFIIDCRSMDEQRDGQIPTAFHFDPNAVTDRQVLEQVLATLNPMKGKVHMCVMGHGYGYIADEIRQHQEQQQLQHSSASTQTQPSPFTLKDNFFEMYATNLTRVNSALLFLMKQGFPYVSVLDGGFAAAHGVLFRSTQFTVDDLIDHNASQCNFCQHHRSMAAPVSASGNGGVASSSTASFGSPGASSMGESKQESFSRSTASSSNSRGNSSANMPSAQRSPSSTNNELDAKSLFDTHASNPGSSYFSGFAGAFKTTGKTFMNPTDSLKDSTKWLMKKTNSSNSYGGDQQAKGGVPPLASADRPLMTGGLPNFNKLRNSLAAMGSESLDLLKKAEQAAVAKTRVPFGGGGGNASSSAAKAPSAAGTITTASAGTSAAASRTGSRSGTNASAAAAPGDRNMLFQKSEEEVFTIDDDDEEDEFVGGGGSGSSRTSSSSSARNESFSGNGSDPHSYPGSPAASTAAITLHNVKKGYVNALGKGMHVSRVQMLPCVESPFFSGYKKKKLGDASGTPGRVSMLPRRLVIAENHLVVLKAERNMDDVYLVKSCHTLSHVARMTCLKKNALMVTVYYKWKSSAEGQVIEKRNSYEVQQRDEFIKAIKGAMEKM